MKMLAAIVLSSLALVCAARAAELARPDWAYAVPGPADAGPPAPDGGKMFSLPGSNRQFPYAKIQGAQDKVTHARLPPADWYPRDHPVMPKIVAEGDDRRGITACGLCHYPNGKGRPQNAGLAGLPADYIARQLRDMRDGLRQSSEPRKANAQQMVGFAKGMTDAEIAAAANYFSAMRWTHWIKVVETARVPKMRSNDGMWLKREGTQSEPIGARIIETPADEERTEILRDPHSGFIAYVPVGAVAKGRRIATGGRAILACTICHGENLGGIGTIPGIAGRSPSYIARQLYDMREGSRHGEMARLMKPVVAGLSTDDIVNVAAYVASLPASAAK